MTEHFQNIKLILAYDGTHYYGWQRQKNRATIQGVLEAKIETLCGDHVTLIGSGRTDAGVHATHQVCNFVTRSRIPLHGMRKGLNSLLPDDIFVKSMEYVPLDFHSRYNARTKTYEYRILNRADPDVFLRRYVWHIRRALDATEMERCLSLLVGRHDFSSFKSSGSENRDPLRTVLRAELQVQRGGLLSLIIEADGFLRHMVRNIVGTIAEVGLGKMTLQGFEEILEAKDRRLAGVKAPAQGLFLKTVQYESPDPADAFFSRPR